MVLVGGVAFLGWNDLPALPAGLGEMQKKTPVKNDRCFLKMIDFGEALSATTEEGKTESESGKQS